MPPQKTHTTQPIVTGTSVVGVKFKGGVLLAADTLGNYGSMARFTNLDRIRQFGSYTLIGASGEFSDFQLLSDILEEDLCDDRCTDDGRQLTGREIYSWLSRVMYNRRMRLNPLWNSLLVAGVHKGDVSLGMVDLYGTAFEEDFIATGFGHHFAMPILREKWRPDMPEEEARQMLMDVMRVLLYRDTRTINKIQVGRIATDGVSISEPFSLDTKWDYKAFIDPKGGVECGGSW
eukprot:gb/GECG01002608.1/.p1 GENE.gb/GECG01002608.1/~~gb/GECG01002608.1/.p1  ORF type:complete len:233 (+),score=23.93 gb/GECG01002608.1/:1-699(+)